MKIIKPMLCELQFGTEGDPPRQNPLLTNPNLSFERKFDGIRAVMEIGITGIQYIQARSGSDKTHLFPDLDCRSEHSVGATIIVDGEIVASTGKFNDIQHRTNRGSGIAEACRDYPAKYMAFDLLQVNDQSAMGYPLDQRRKLLATLLQPSPTCEIAQVFTDGAKLWQEAIDKGWEGIIGKPNESRYSENNRGTWFKFKVPQDGVFWVVGYTKGTGWREKTFGAMILAQKGEDGGLFYCGSVGTGFNDAEINRLFTGPLSKVVPAMPFYSRPKDLPISVQVTWVEPFAVKIRYLEVTNTGSLRFPAYKGQVSFSGA